MKKTNTKKAIAIRTVKTLNRRKVKPARKVFVETLMSKLECSKGMASTYYQNIVSGRW